jgi:hypothetical protein
MNKDKSLIPPGPYCYHRSTSEINQYGIPKAIPCPYYGSKVINEVSVPWCTFLDSGGLSNHHSDEDVKKLIEHFGSEEKLNETLHLSLLWDQVKECAINEEL